MPKTTSHWNRRQMAEKLKSLGNDLRILAADIKRPQTPCAAISSWHREVAGCVEDMSALLAGEMPNSDRAMHKAEPSTKPAPKGEMRRLLFSCLIP